MVKLSSRLLLLTAVPFCTAFAPLDVFKQERYLSWNSDYNVFQCLDFDSAVTVAVDNKPMCMRYFASDGVQDAEEVLIVLYGDRDKNDRLPVDEIKNNTVATQRQYAERKAKQYGMPAIIIARPGTYGSSGVQKDKRFKPEYLAIDAAITALQKRYRFKKIVLLGHSGGATLGAGLLTLGRSDIACYVLTSGAYDLDKRSIWFRTQRGMDVNAYRKGRYDPLTHVDNIVPQPNTQVFLIGDTRDTRTGYQFQVAMQQALVDAGIRAEMVEAEARPPDFHNLKDDYGFRCARKCAQEQATSCKRLTIHKLP